MLDSEEHKNLLSIPKEVDTLLDKRRRREDAFGRFSEEAYARFLNLHGIEAASLVSAAKAEPRTDSKSSLTQPELVPDIGDDVILGWRTDYEANMCLKSVRDYSSDDTLSEPTRWEKINQRIPRQSIANAIRYSGDGHCITIAPTGSGKGVGVIIPNLLHYKGPIVVIDPKGENFCVTASFRRTVLNHKVYLLDPFHAVSDNFLQLHGLERGRLNPVDLCQLEASNQQNDAQMIASLLSGSGSLGDDPFWDISARRLLSGVLSLEMTLSKREGRPPRFSNITDILFSDDVVYNLASALDTKRPDKFSTQCIGSFLQLADVTRTGILATVQSYLSVIMAEDIQRFLNESTISLQDIISHTDYTVYIVIPPNKLESHGVLLRAWVNTLLHAVMERKELPAQRTLFMLDECANLGALDTLRKAVTLLRGYGLQVWMFFQDLSQLTSLYSGESETMINNCGVFQAFGISRLRAAQEVSSIVGTFAGRTIARMHRSEQLLSIASRPPFTGRLFRYYSDCAFAGRFETNPLRRSSPAISPVWNSHDDSWGFIG